MKTQLPKNLDQMEMVTHLSKLKEHAENLRDMVHKAPFGRPVQPPSLSGDIFEDISTLETHCIELEAKLGDKAPAFNFKFSAASAAGGNKSRSEGGSSTASVSPPGAASNLTLTQRVLQARGVNTLEELADQRASMGLEKYQESAGAKPTSNDKTPPARRRQMDKQKIGATLVTISGERTFCTNAITTALIIVFFALALFNTYGQDQQPDPSRPEALTVFNPLDTIGVHVLRNGGTNFIAANSSDAFSDFGPLWFPLTYGTNFTIGIGFSTVTPVSSGSVTLAVFDGIYGLAPTNGTQTGSWQLNMCPTPCDTFTFPINSTNSFGIATNYNYIVFEANHIYGNRYSLLLVNTNNVALTNEDVKIMLKLVKYGAVPAAR